MDRMILLIVLILTGGFLNVYFSYVPFAKTGLVFQLAFAVNAINNQSSSSNSNCDLSSTCSTSHTQLGTVGAGDGNLIDQDITQRNNHCVETTFCDLNADQRATIGESSNGLILDFGRNNHNSQTHSIDSDSENENTIIQVTEQDNNNCSHGSTCQQADLNSISLGQSITSDMFIVANNNNLSSNNRIENSVNNNFVSHEDLQKNQHCKNGSSCNNFINHILGAGNINVYGTSSISVGFDNNNNDAVQNASMSGSSNRNTAAVSRVQENSHCEGSCSNGYSAVRSLGEIAGDSISLSGNNNKAQQDTEITDSIDGNVLDQMSVQKNTCKGQTSSCNNSITGSDIIGGSAGGLVFNEGNNNIHEQNEVNSNNENRLTYSQTQLNDCGNSSCQSSSFHETQIGKPISSGLTGTIFNFFGDNNTNVQSINQHDSNNRNVLSYSEDLKNNCSASLICSNDVSSVASIGSAQSQSVLPQPAGRILNVGNNNELAQNNSVINSNNDNKIVQKISQDNNHCMEANFCTNRLLVGGQVGDSNNGVILNAGDNNTISDSLITEDSNNDNKIEQVADQTNEACSDLTICGNHAAAFSRTGSTTSDDITDGLQSNQQISQTTVINNTNNQNTILQKYNQKNLCRDMSICDNNGIMTADIQNENNQLIDQSIYQNNLCLNNAICNNNGEVVGASGSNTQSNTCVGGASCFNGGTDNKNICTNGATCINSGTNTKVVSNGDPCAPETDNSVTICSHGRIINRPT